MTQVYFIEEEVWDGGTFSAPTRTILAARSTLALAKEYVKELQEKLPPKIYSWSSKPEYTIKGPFKVDA